MDKNKNNNEQIPEKTSFVQMDEKEFLIEILTEFVTLKNLAHDGKTVPVWKNCQKVSDKIKARIKLL
jgi:hypothetical protein